MKKYTLYLFFMFVLCSCSINKQVATSHNQESTATPILKINSLNLSEDLSRLSSQNDEILILVYKRQDILSAPLIMEYIVFDETQKTFDIPINPVHFENTSLLLYMLELDTDLPPKELEIKIRKSVKQLEIAFTANDRIAQKQILGDDDILAFKRISKEEVQNNFTYNIIGTHKMDRYEYELQFLNLKK